MNDSDRGETSEEFDPDLTESGVPTNGKSFGNPHPKWVFRLVLGTLAYSICARAFGWPLPNLGFKLFQGFLTELSLMVWVLLITILIGVITRKFRQAHDSDTRRLATAKIEQFLMPDERLIWTGSPDFAFYRSRAWAHAIFGILPAMIGLTILATMVSVMLGGHFHPTQAFALLIGAVFAGIGIFAMATPWRYRRMIRRCQYGVTDRRVLILHGIGWTSTVDPKRLRTGMIEVNPPTIRQRARKRRSGTRVDLIFGQEPQPGFGGISKDVDYGILALREWHETEGILKSRFGQESPSMPLLEPPIEGSVAPKSAVMRIISGVFLAAVISPWFLLGGAMMAAGARAVRQPAASGLAVALPGGVLLTGAVFAILFHALWKVPRRVIRHFVFDGSCMRFETIDEPDGELKLGEIRDVIEQQGSKGRGIRGWHIRRFDGPTLFLPVAASRGSELAQELERRIASVDSADLPLRSRSTGTLDRPGYRHDGRSDYGN